ncbi:MAG: hypothetical protein GX318_02205 [Clostridia bacterium]|nr:hypothetical protein [Clostridia bacterium]
MRSKAIMSVLLILLAAALIGGTTMAWFTDDAELDAAQLETGTLEIDADGSPKVTPMPERDIKNVNPGDCATVCWDIENIGSKRAELRVKLTGAWVDGSDASNVYFAPKPGSDWVMYEEDNGLYMYYTGGPLAGTYGDTEGGTAKLCVVVGFDGEGMGNEYQGLGYTLNGVAEAIQATNGAPEDMWPGFAEATAAGYSDAGLRDYFINGAGKDMPCYNGGEDPPPPAEYEVTLNVVTKDCEGNVVSSKVGGTVSGAGTYVDGASVTVGANAKQGYEFLGWSGDLSGTDTSKTFEITGDVTATATFKEICTPKKVKVTITPKLCGNKIAGTVEGFGSGTTKIYNVGDTVNLKAVPSAGYVFDKWDGYVTGGTNPTSFVVPNHDVTINANFKTAPKYTLTLTKNYNSYGTVTGGGQYAEGTNVSINATPGTYKVGWQTYNYKFVGWYDGNTLLSTSKTHTYTMPASNKTLQAKFSK